MELMTVIAILAVLLSIAIPNFLGAAPARRLESAATAIQSALQRARMTAVKDNRCVVIVFTSGNNRYRIFADDGDVTPVNACNKIQDAGEPDLKTGELPAGVELTTLVPSITILFNSRGFTDSGVAIWFNNKNASGPDWKVDLNITGSSRIDRG